MNRREILLAALASGRREEFSPVQLQKMMFLIDRNIGNSLGGPFFNFEPYDYGPFDVGVYNEFSTIAQEQLGEESGHGSYRRYRLNDEGRGRAQEVLNTITPEYREYIEKIARFVQSLSFGALVSTIYKYYPDMKVNSVFKD
jgi:hypothetical protein